MSQKGPVVGRVMLDFVEDILTEGLLVNKIDLQALYLSGTYCHKISTRPPSCAKPQQSTIYADFLFQ